MSSPCPRCKRARLSTLHPPRTRTCGNSPRSLRRKRGSRSGSTSSRFSTKATKQVALNSHPGFAQGGDPAGWNKPRREHVTHHARSTAGARCPPSNRTDKKGDPTGRSLASKTKSKGGSHGYGLGQMPANRTRDPHWHQDRSREFWAQPGVFQAHPLPDLPRQSHVVRTGSLGRRAERRGAAWQRGFLGLIIHTGHRDRDGGRHGSHTNLHCNDLRLSAKDSQTCS